MKKFKSRIAALMITVIMALTLSGCSANNDPVVSRMIDFWINGWDGVYTVTERAHYVKPTVTVRRHAIRENHKATQTHNVSTSSGSVSYSYGYGVASTDGPAE